MNVFVSFALVFISFSIEYTCTIRECIREFLEREEREMEEGRGREGTARKRGEGDTLLSQNAFFLSGAYIHLILYDDEDVALKW